MKKKKLTKKEKKEFEILGKKITQLSKKLRAHTKRNK